MPMHADLAPELEALAAVAKSGSIDLARLARFIAKAAPRCIYSSRYREFFNLWQESGFHLMPVHFYNPIPDTRALPTSVWERESNLTGIDMNDVVQLDLLRNCFPRFRDEYSCFPQTADNPNGISLLNGFFDGTDALTAYCMIRHFRPRTIIEVGSGYSSLFSARAATKNGNCDLICIEPYPRDFLRKGIPGMSTLIAKQVQEVEHSFFSRLQTNDILFIDSSHTIKIGGDVNYLFLEILPRLNPGVIVHIHDIFFPVEYRRDWVMDELRFWTEQYVLQAFLTYNSEFEILFANNYMARQHLEDFKVTFPSSPWWGGGSFWMRRKAQ
jgi:hypothetical protein